MAATDATDAHVVEDTLVGERVERRFRAILAADVVGYSRLTGVDEEGRHFRLKEQLRVLVDRGVIGAYRLDVIPPRHRNAVLGSLELRLQRKEIGIGFQIRVIFSDREQPAERTGQLILRVLELLELVRIGELGRIRRPQASPRTDQSD